VETTLNLFFSFNLGREPDVLRWETATMERKMLWQNDQMEHRRGGEVCLQMARSRPKGKTRGCSGLADHLPEQSSRTKKSLVVGEDIRTYGDRRR